MLLALSLFKVLRELQGVSVCLELPRLYWVSLMHFVLYTVDLDYGVRIYRANLDVIIHDSPPIDVQIVA